MTTLTINQDTKWNNNRKILVKGNRTIRGITKLQPKAFYPVWKWYKALQIQVNTIDLMGVSKDHDTRLIKGGLRVGTTMDKHITTSVKLQLKYKLPINIFYDENVLDKWSKTFQYTSHQQQIKTICRQRNPYVRRFWQFMYHEKWTPIATQVAISHPDYNFGTMADVVIMDQHKNIRVLEIKTGFEKYLLNKCSDHMLSPFEKMNDAPIHQHIIQLLATQSMYRMSHPNKIVASGFVVRFDSYGVYKTEIPACLNTTNVIEQMFYKMNQVLSNG